MRLPDPERSRVVLIGTSRYEDEKLPDLPAVGRDIEDLKTVLTDPVYGLVPENHCDVMEDEGDIRLIGRRLRSAAGQAEDVLLVYFAGHGLTAGRRHDLYLALQHTEWEAPEFNALEYDKLRSLVLNSPATTKMIILDCCFSGRAFGDSMADPATELIGQVEVNGSYVLASAHRDRVSLALPGEDHTAFTGRMLRLFHDGVPGGPELLTIDDIYQQLRTQMKAEGLPQPHKRGTDTASLLAVARNRAFAATAPPLFVKRQNLAPSIPSASSSEAVRDADAERAAMLVSVTVQWVDPQVRRDDRLHDDEQYWVMYVRNSSPYPLQRMTVTAATPARKVTIEFGAIEPGDRQVYILRPPDDDFPLDGPVPEASATFEVLGVRWRLQNGRARRFSERPAAKNSPKTRPNQRRPHLA